MDDEVINNSADVPYNFSLFFYMSLKELLDQKDKAYMNNDIFDWYKISFLIFKRICFKLQPNEEKDLNIKFLEAKDLLIANNEDGVCVVLNDIDFIIIKLMDKYKMIFPRNTQFYGLDKINARYGLKGGLKDDN